MATGLGLATILGTVTVLGTATVLGTVTVLGTATVLGTVTVLVTATVLGTVTVLGMVYIIVMPIGPLIFEVILSDLHIQDLGLRDKQTVLYIDATNWNVQQSVPHLLGLVVKKNIDAGIDYQGGMHLLVSGVVFVR